MAYPEEHGISFTDHESIRIVEIAGLLPTHATKNFANRTEGQIRKVLIHHHAGAAKSTVEKRADGIPKSCWSTAQFFVRADDPAKAGTQGRNWAGYAYHYDIGYGEDRSAGKDLVFQTQLPTKIGFHTGAGQNEMGISISHMGYMRHLDAPTGASYSPNDGKPHEAQKRALPLLVDYLQDKYAISDLHVQGHFQHKKPACPGWDIEYWLMKRELRSAGLRQAFCWPIAPGSKDEPTFLRHTSGAAQDAAKLIAANKAGGTGFFPFGRRFLWHDGIHLFPDSGEGANVYAVRDGWVIGARLNKNVVLDGKDYGSASFVLVMHEDPGLYDPLDKRTSGSRRRPTPLVYFSLYMHLGPLDDTIGWVAMLKERDRARYDQLMANPELGRNVAGVALPVKAGEVIGKVGKHNPFAARHPDLDATDEAVFEAEKHAVLHFEIFFRDHLVKRFDPDKDLHKKYTLKDTDRDSLADDIIRKLDRLTGFSDESVEALREAVEAAATTDPGFQDPSAWTVALTSDLQEALSTVIVEHRSEWNADWNSVINSQYRQWGLSTAERDHFKNVIREFQWWREVVRTEGIHRARLTGLSANARPFYAHPLRLLCWLVGLRRELDANITGGEDEHGYPNSTNIDADLWILTTIRANASAGDTTVRVKGSIEATRFDGGSFRIKGHASQYRITAHSEILSGSRVDSYDLTISPALEKDVRKNAKIKLGNYGWHFEQSFDWDTDLTGA